MVVDETFYLNLKSKRTVRSPRPIGKLIQRAIRLRLKWPCATIKTSRVPLPSSFHSRCFSFTYGRFVKSFFQEKKNHDHTLRITLSTLEVISSMLSPPGHLRKAGWLEQS